MNCLETFHCRFISTSAMRKLIGRLHGSLARVANNGGRRNLTQFQLSGANKAKLVICDHTIDITYIRLLREFVYLAVILDSHSRRVIGWALEPYLEAGLALEALRMALASREIEAGLVHHSDRGVQYASSAYTDLLKERGIRISMSRRGNPYDNAKAERFMKTLKYEEVYLFEYETMAEARERIGHFLEEVYNQKRLHSALGYVPPVEFEQHLCQIP